MSDTIAIARLDRGRIVVVEIIRVGSGPKGVAIGDLNGDRKPDLVVAHLGDNGVGILLAR